MERNGESASKNHYVRRLARITEKKNGEFRHFKGFYNKTAKKSRLFFRFFSFYLVKSVRTVRMAKVAHS